MSAMFSEHVTPFMHCSEEESLKILIVFQYIFSLSEDLGGPSAVYLDLDSLKWEVKIEMFMAIRCIATSYEDDLNYSKMSKWVVNANHIMSI